MTQELSGQLRSQPAKFLSSWIIANFFGGFLVGFLEDNGLQFMATLILTGPILGVMQWGVAQAHRQRFSVVGSS